MTQPTTGQGAITSKDHFCAAVARLIQGMERRVKVRSHSGYLTKSTSTDAKYFVRDQDELNLILYISELLAYSSGCVVLKDIPTILEQCNIIFVRKMSMNALPKHMDVTSRTTVRSAATLWAHSHAAATKATQETDPNAKVRGYPDCLRHGDINEY